MCICARSARNNTLKRIDCPDQCYIEGPLYRRLPAVTSEVERIRFAHVNAFLRLRKALKTSKQHLHTTPKRKIKVKPTMSTVNQYVPLSRVQLLCKRIALRACFLVNKPRCLT